MPRDHKLNNNKVFFISETLEKRPEQTCHQFGSEKRSNLIRSVPKELEDTGLTCNNPVLYHEVMRPVIRHDNNWHE